VDLFHVRVSVHSVFFVCARLRFREKSRHCSAEIKSRSLENIFYVNATARSPHKIYRSGKHTGTSFLGDYLQSFILSRSHFAGVALQPTENHCQKHFF
jgi:hypothetical protein